MSVASELLMRASWVIEEALARHNPSHVFGLFSGGHDSLCSTHVASGHPSFSGAVHIDTGIGIRETRLFVEQTARRQGWPLHVYTPDAKTYDELVLDKGFPSGPKSHNAMYYWLKQTSGASTGSGLQAAPEGPHRVGDGNSSGRVCSEDGFHHFC
jgi:3'-phosphoadenosine 5'-phosphosulfate sulfotransferase (PAPS reductase)/FAD synthetase